MDFPAGQLLLLGVPETADMGTMGRKFETWALLLPRCQAKATSLELCSNEWSWILVIDEFSCFQLGVYIR
eukprot:763794-Hanusia_phi.AAC.2